jgi:tetratricopeptide (TPR) repeat protein
MAASTHIASIIEESYALERSGEIAAAYRRAREALKEARASGEPDDVGSALVCVAYSEYHLGHYREAEALIQEALTLVGPQERVRADALRLLGDCAHEAADLAGAESCYRRAIDLGRQLGDPYILHRCLHSLSACVYIPRGQFELASAADDESLRLAEDHDVLEEIWLPLVTMGCVYWVTGRRARALEVVEETRRFVQPGSLAQGYWNCLSGDLAQEGDHPASAVELYARARYIPEEIGDPGLNGELRVGLSRYHRNAGNAPAVNRSTRPGFRFPIPSIRLPIITSLLHSINCQGFKKPRM